MARSLSRFQHRARSRRLTTWTVGCESNNQAFSANGSTIWSQGVQLVAESQATIVRCRGLISATLLTAAAAGDGFFGAFGIGIVNENAFTVGGTTSVPTPITDIDWPGWLWHQFFDVRAVTATIGDGVNAVGAYARFEIDSKAMRKMGDEEVLMGVTQVEESGAATMEVNANTRLLFKLS